MSQPWENLTTEEQVERIIYTRAVLDDLKESDVYGGRDPRESECLWGRLVPYGPSFLREGYEGRTPKAKCLSEHEEVRGFELPCFRESW